ncbi:MAG TPA: hypothetical protein VLA19_21225 [Herpetosiphonaceae bacterium]|nr:hypothetical protein [Herpetosiphonaceae bacterium]
MQHRLRLIGLPVALALCAVLSALCVRPSAAARVAPQAAGQSDDGQLDDPARIAAARPRERDQAALVEMFKGTGDIPEVARSAPLAVKVGDVQRFNVVNSIEDTSYVVTATLRYAGPIVLMYVDNAAKVSQDAIQRSARTFENKIYARNRALFGSEVSPGVDGDPRLTILNTPLSGAGGYFSSADSVVKAVNRFSNEREMFVIGINSYPLGTNAYAATLAHEFQHMIAANQQQRSPSWFNEGLSTLAEDLNGYVKQHTAQLALAQPDIRLTGWSSSAAQTGEHYGASHLFMRYFHQHYAGDRGLQELARLDAGNDLDAFARVAARKRPDIRSFADLYADWAVANYVNNRAVSDGRFAYRLLPGRAQASLAHAGEGTATVNQFGADYLGVVSGPATLSFDGADSVSLTGTVPASGGAMWWSNRGDDSVSTLTRSFDLTGLEQATLNFSAWHEIERDWDYAYVAVSVDGGATWQALRGSTTTGEDPQGQNLGNGLTGVSGAAGAKPDQGVRGRWIEEQMDLSAYGGKQILLRFWMVTDAAYNAAGLALDNIRIPELGYYDDVEAGDGAWQAEGFVRTTGKLPQRWEVRLVRTTRGRQTVERVMLDGGNRALLRLRPGERGVVVVAATTPVTDEQATYTYRIVRQ